MMMVLSSPLGREEIDAQAGERCGGQYGLFVLGANHQTADLSVRSLFSLNGDRIRDLTERFGGPEREFLALSTCNRTEFYLVGIDPAELSLEISRFSGLSIGQVQSHTYLKSGREAIAHLFSVACGLNSAAVGESEILGQLKSAFSFGESLGSIGRTLNPLLQRALRVSKRVRSESEIGRRGLSVASVAVRRALGPSGGSGKKVLIIGAGQMAESVAKNLFHQKCKDVTILSRTFSKAFSLAAMHGFNAVSSGHFEEALASADVIFSAAAVEAPIILESSHAAALKPGATLVDLGVPANACPQFKQQHRVRLLDMEDLLAEVAVNVAQVTEALPKAMSILEEEVEAFLAEREARGSASSIEALVSRVEQVRLRNLEWALSQIPVENVRERKLLEDLSIRLTRGMLSDPIQKLKNDFREPAERAVLARFFQAES